MNENPLVSIIIVNYNGKNELKKCLNSLLQIDYKNFEIIVVDNNSSDNSVEYVKENFSEINVIKLKKNFGFAEPNNIGAENAKGELLVFLNNDTVVTPNFITELINTLKKDPKISILQSTLLKSDGSVDSAGDYIDTHGIAYNTKILPSKISPIFSARAASMMIKKNVFSKLGGFDKNFFASFEDVDLGWRSWIFGYQSAIVPTSVVYHEGGQTIKKLESEIQFHGIKNTLLLILVNFEFPSICRSLFFLNYALIAKKIFHKEVIQNFDVKYFPPFSQVIRGILWNLKNMNYLFKKRRFVNSHRVLSTQELINLGLIKR